MNNTECGVSRGTLARKNAAVALAEMQVFGSDAATAGRIFADSFD